MGHAPGIALVLHPRRDPGAVLDAIGAPDKATWNLEPWRPDVGLFAVLAGACNPT